MILLNNGCSRSDFSVQPTDWDIDISNFDEEKVKKVSARLLKEKWRVTYRYYDPAFKNTEKWGKQIPLKCGINRIKDLALRQAAIRSLLADEKDRLENQLYNPITEKFHTTPGALEEITPSMLFGDALWKAYDMLKCVPRMLDDIRSAINGITDSAGKLFDKTYQKPYTGLKISQVSRKHIVYIFEQRKKDSDKFTTFRQNRYRAYLVMLYKILVKVEAVEHNIINDIPVEKGHVKKKRQLFTPTELLLIDTNVRAWDYYFWRYIRIFHRSGSRSTEMFALKPEKVNLESQEFIVLVKKGREYVEQVRPIPDDILQFWIEVLNEAKPGQHIFSEDFRPGAKQIDDGWIHRRWYKYVQGHAEEWENSNLRRENCLYIKKTFYTFKAQNTDEIDKQLDLEHAAAADGHTDTNTTKNHYALGHERRKIEKLKKIKVDFS